MIAAAPPPPDPPVSLPYKAFCIAILALFLLGLVICFFSGCSGPYENQSTTSTETIMHSINGTSPYV